jgi:hypothetical protein
LSGDGPEDFIDVASPFGEVLEGLFFGFFGESSDDGLVTSKEVCPLLIIAVVDDIVIVSGCVEAIVEIDESFGEFRASTCPWLGCVKVTCKRTREDWVKSHGMTLQATTSDQKEGGRGGGGYLTF